MKTVLIRNIISENTAYQINAFIQKHKRELGQVRVFFCAETESNRYWNRKLKLSFDYKILPHLDIQLRGSDLFTYFVNLTIIKELNSYNPDRLIISGWDLFASQLAYIWGFLRKKHTTLWSGSTRNETSWRRTITLPLVKFFVRISTDYLAYGLRAKEYLVSLGAKPDRVSIFLNDVDRRYFTSQAKKLGPQKIQLKRKFNVTKPRNFLYVGQLIQRKGLIEFLAAYRKFKTKHPGWGIVIVGAGVFENKIRDYIKAQAIKNVNFLGVIGNESLPQIYATCEVLVLPSTEEVWGRVVNEALYSGLKVVVSDKCGCVPDLIRAGINGYSFKSGSIASLVGALNKIVNLTK